MNLYLYINNSYRTHDKRHGKSDQLSDNGRIGSVNKYLCISLCAKFFQIGYHKHEKTALGTIIRNCVRKIEIVGSSKQGLLHCREKGIKT